MGKTTTRAMLATEGLDVSRADGLVLVNDGHTRWLCDARYYDEVVALLATETVDIDGMDAVELQNEKMWAYGALCRRVAGPVVTTGYNEQGWPEEKEELVRWAVAAGLLSSDDPLVKRYTATGQGE